MTQQEANVAPTKVNTELYRAHARLVKLISAALEAKAK